MSTKATEINIDFHKAKALADEIESIASELRQLIKNDFRPSLDALSVAWRGENAKRFVAKEQITLDDLSQTALSLERTASAIRTAAKRAYDAEMQAIQAALSSSGAGNGGGGGASGNGF